jgi:roadblock/LC7 domain-containing protein
VYVPTAAPTEELFLEVQTALVAAGCKFEKPIAVDFLIQNGISFNGNKFSLCLDDDFGVFIYYEDKTKINELTIVLKGVR